MHQLQVEELEPRQLRSGTGLFPHPSPFERPDSHVAVHTLDRPATFDQGGLHTRPVAPDRPGGKMLWFGTSAGWVPWGSHGWHSSNRVWLPPALPTVVVTTPGPTDTIVMKVQFDPPATQPTASDSFVIEIHIDPPA